MKFLIASLAFCACVCLSMASYGSNVGYGSSGYGGYAAHVQPAAVLNYAVPVYNIPSYGGGYNAAPAYGNVGYNAAPAYGHNAGYGSSPASASSAAAASAAVRGNNNYAAPSAAY